MTTKPIASRDSILNFVDFRTRDVEVPEWGGMIVRVRSMTAAERDTFEAPAMAAAANGKDINLTNFRAKIVALTAIDADGNRLFTDKDVEALGNKDGAAIDRLSTAVMELSGLTTAEIDELGKGIAPTNGTASASS